MADLLTGINTSKPESTNEGNTSTPAPTLTTNQDSGLGLSNAPAATPAPAPALIPEAERAKKQFEQQQGTMGLVDQGIQEKTAARAKQQFGLQQESMAKTNLGLQQKAAIEAPVVQPIADATELGLALNTAEDQTKRIDELSSTALDVEGKTAEDIQDEIYNRNKEIFVRDKIRADQMSQERYAQKLAQQGFAGSGTSEALQMMLQTTNANGTASGLESLSLANLNRQATDQREQESHMMSLYQSAAESGDMTMALKVANQMAAMSPDNDYWAYIAANPDAMKNMFDPNVQARIVANRGLAHDKIASLDFENQAAVDGAYSGWRGLNWLDDDDLAAERAGAWSSVSDADKARIFAEEFGSQIPQDLSDIQKDEIYAKYAYEQKVRNMENSLMGDTITKQLKADGVSDQDLEDLQENMNYFLDSPGAAQSFLIDGMDFEGRDLASEKAKFLFEDWYGADYDTADNSRTGRDQYNQDMDEMWKSYTDRMVEGDVLATREDFIEALEATNYVEGSPLSAKEIGQAVEGLQDAKGITPMKAALADVGVTAGDSKSFMQLSKTQVEELLEDGTITPGALSDELWAVQDTTGKFADSGALGNKMAGFGDKNWGIQAMKTGSYPRYTVIDGIMYHVGVPSSDEWKRKASYTMTPIGDNEGAENFELLVDLTEGDRSGAFRNASVGLKDFDDQGVAIEGGEALGFTPNAPDYTDPDNFRNKLRF